VIDPEAVKDNPGAITFTHNGTEYRAVAGGLPVSGLRV
jgi:hypothetical protein